ncbi:MAG: gamma-glutamylcyclotransferase [Bryobacteraceae bacterium]|nr:gamma-glutamylcyclotransferase [Bryobacteraceae bacterium]MCL4797190.1 gamma-glutamylcyclotransferase [Bryobacteraceae bacterium]
MDRLFAYGTLRSGGPRHAVLRRARPARVVEAWAPGRLLDLGEYPGLIEGRGRVAGELFEFDSLEALLPLLDEIEGARFRRAQIVVETAAGEFTAWAYLWAGPRGAGPVIASGDWAGR